MFRRTLWTLTLSALLFGCAPGNPGLLIMNVVAPDETCTYAVGNPQYLGGTLDVGSLRPTVTTSGYIATFRFGNQLLNLSRTGSAGPPMADPNVMQIQRFEVTLQDVGGAPLPLLQNPYTVYAGGGLIPSSDGGSAGEGIGGAEIIPATYIPDLAALAGTDSADIVVNVQAIGVTAGGAEVISNPFFYPIHLCAGCLVPGCVRDADMAAVCSPACIPGQDDVHLTPAQCGEATVCQVGG
jgi:hypothetical protein